MSYKLNKYLLIIVLLIATGLTSCKKYLDSLGDSANTSYLDVKTAFASVSNANGVLLGAYEAFQGDQAYGIRLNLYYTVDCDEFRVSGNLDNGRRGIGMYHLDPSNTEIAAPYNRLYLAVERANLCIEQLPLMPTYNGADSVILHAMHGQALAIRAMAYLELIRNWGDVPSIMVPSYRLPLNYSFVKADRDSIYNQLILKDLPLAETLLQWPSTPTPNRFNKASVLALKARIALFRGGYSLRRAASPYGQTMARTADYKDFYAIAKDACAQIINQNLYQLDPSFEDIFKNYFCGYQSSTAGAKEVLFQVAMDDGQTNGGEISSKLGYYNGPKLSVNTTFGSGGGGILALPTYFYAFDSNDTRRDVTITVYQRAGAGGLNDNSKTVQKLTAITDGKFRKDWDSKLAANNTIQYPGFDWPVLRYSDVLLMYAEADNEVNGAPSGDAVTYFEAVRNRGLNGKPIGVTPTNHDDFFNAIVNERSFEFGDEGIRKYDLIRWNLLGTKINQTKTDFQNILAIGSTGTGIAPTGKYSNLPMTMFYTYDASTDKINWLNSLYAPTPTTKPGGVYTTIDWCKGASSYYTTSPSPGNIISYAQYFTPNHNELLPIAQSVIDVSNGTLVNDYGY